MEKAEDDLPVYERIIKYSVTLLDTETNEEKEIPQIRPFFDSENLESLYDSIEFEWMEGNMSRDCNRFSLFYPEKNDIIPCSYDDKTRFVLLRINHGKKIIYSKDRR